jgi:hypothetical protein
MSQRRLRLARRPMQAARDKGQHPARARPGLDNSGALAMATLIVMDHIGDTRHHLDVEDIEALSKAEERFEKLTALGFTAAVHSASGDVTVTRAFDANAEETLFFPRLVGG